MANSGISNISPQIWAKEAEKSLFVDNKAMAIATTRLLTLAEGDTVTRSIVSYPASATYTPGSDITTQAIAGSAEDLSIATWLASLVTIDDTEKVQSIIDLASNISNKMMKDHNNRLEQAVLAEVSNSLHSIDDGELNIAVGKFGYMLEQLGRLLVGGGFAPLKI